MIDLKLLRDDPDRVRSSQRARGEDASVVDRLLAADERRRTAEASYGALRNEQKELGKAIGPLQGRLKKADDAERPALQAELDSLMSGASDLADRVKGAEAERDTADVEAAELLAQLSNVVDPAAPVGGEDDFVVLEHVGTPRDFAAEGFTARDHVELGELLGAIDIERGAKVSGSRFYYLTGVGALLELALISHAVATATGNGFTPVIPPALVKPPAMEGTGFLGQAAENVYRLEADDMYLVGTAEVPLAAYHSDEILDAAHAAAPLRRLVAELPPRGGLARQGHPRHLARALVRQGRDVLLLQARGRRRRARAAALASSGRCSTASSCPTASSTSRPATSAARPRASSTSRRGSRRYGDYREVTSTSNCTEFQARRLKVRLRDEDGVRPLATLNGTLVAVTRIIVALLENHQQADGSVHVPVALRPYLGGRETLTPLG